MSDILEKSLDDIIGESKSHGPRRGGPSRRGAGRPSRGHGSKVNKPYARPGRERGPAPRHSGPSLPRDIISLAGPRPVLRVRNIHPDLNGEDLSKLFGSISPVDFVKFDNRNDSIAYVCFQRDNTRSNAEAIRKYDGKKAMGEILGIESATSLVDRIGTAPVRRAPPGRRERGGKPGGAEKAKPKRAKPVKKSADDLDAELAAYMNGQGEAQEPNQEQEAPQEPQQESAPQPQAEETSDAMNLD